MFNINTLSESFSDDTIKNNTTPFNEETESYLYTMLEFNDKLHEIDINDKLEYYRALKESCDNEDKGLAPVNEVVGAVLAVGLIAIITAMCVAISKIIQLFTQSKNFCKKVKDDVEGAYKKAKSSFNKSSSTQNSSNSNTSTSYSSSGLSSSTTSPTLYTQQEFTMYKCLDRVQAFADAFNHATQNLVVATNLAVNGQSKNDDPSKPVAIAYKLLNKQCRNLPGNRKDFNEDITDAASFKKYMTENFIYEYTKKVTAEEYILTFVNIDDMGSGKAIGALNSMKRSLDDCKKTFERNKESMTKEKQEVAQRYINALKEMINAGLFVLNKNNSNFMAYAKSARNMAYKFSVDQEKTGTRQAYDRQEVNNFKGKPDDLPNYVESGLIHGEEFDSNTLFANKDMRDFNPTEWLDLSLTTECFEAKYILDEANRRIALQEAMILTDNDFRKFDRLISMREAEAEKANTGMKGVMESIKKAIEQFLNKLKEVSKKNLNILNRNESFLKQPFTIEKVVSDGDILAGMYRIQKDINLVPFNYEQLKNDLGDKKVFFSKHVIQTLGNTSSNYSKRNVKWDDNMTIVDYCKAYYGGRLDPNKYPRCEFNTKDLEDNRENIIKYLKDPSILNKIKGMERKLDAESKKVTNSIANPVNNNQNTTNNNTNNNSNNNQTPATGNAASNNNNSNAANNNTTVQHNSYYSNLYGAFFTEADINKGQTNNNQQNNSTTNTGNNTAADNGAANKASKESDAFKVYMECYKDVILAKLTASEFINSELTQIMIAHAESHMNTQQLNNERQLRKNEKENNNNQQQQNNNQQNNNQNNNNQQ